MMVQDKRAEWSDSKEIARVQPARFPDRMLVSLEINRLWITVRSVVWKTVTAIKQNEDSCKWGKTQSKFLYHL